MKKIQDYQRRNYIIIRNKENVKETSEIAKSFKEY